MENVLVIGAGFMGSGIAQVCAQSGYRVQLMDIRGEALERALKEIRWSASRLYQKGLISTPPETVMVHIAPVQDLDGAGEADWVIESVLEIEDLKKEIFQQVDRLAPEDTPLATNTSSIPITCLAQATRHPERVLGLHFFGPVPLMGLVEVVRGEQTASDIFQRGEEFVRSLQKTPVRVHRDIPGFVMNRIFGAAFREAVDLVAQEIVSPEEVDIGMRLGYGWNAGPFEVADNAGLDTWALIAQSFQNLGVEHLIPRSKLVEEMVAEGRLGRKAGEGFYRYTKDGKRLPWGDNGSEAR
jgi:3-hydroxybutyryl-CoA dehydrogenase